MAWRAVKVLFILLVGLYVAMPLRILRAAWSQVNRTAEEFEKNPMATWRYIKTGRIE